MLKPRILHKGLAVLSLPLILQVACIAQLYNLVNSAEKLAKNETRLRKTFILVDEILAEFGNSWTPMMSDVFGSSVPSNSARFDMDAYLKRMNSDFEEASSLSNGDPEEVQVLDSARSIVSDQYRILKRLSTSSEDQPSITSKLSLVMQLRPELQRLRPHIEKVKEQIRFTRARMEQAAVQEALAREQIKSQVLFVLLAELALTVLLIAFFLLDITRRLSVLVENAKLIPSQTPLTRSVPGSDELAYLDGILHAASSELRRAAEHRSSLMQMVAHDLRTPLGSATLAIDAVIDPDKSMPEQERIDRAKGIKKILNQVIAFVEDLLTIEKLEASKLDLNYDAVDIKQLVDDSFEAVMMLAADKGIELRNETKQLTIGADPHRIVQVMSNLLSNAIKFSPSASTITVTSEQRPTELAIFVADQGPGVAAAEQANLFNKFYQTQDGKPSEGFGLGLAICKLIVAQHGGSIGVTSQPGQGCVFWFTLPIDAESN